MPAAQQSVLRNRQRVKAKKGPIWKTEFLDFRILSPKITRNHTIDPMQSRRSCPMSFGIPVRTPYNFMFPALKPGRVGSPVWLLSSCCAPRDCDYARLHCFVRLACLPIPSILLSRSCAAVSLGKNDGPHLLGCTGQVRAFAHTFGVSAPTGGFGVWWLCPPNPALASNACRWVAVWSANPYRRFIAKWFTLL